MKRKTNDHFTISAESAYNYLDKAQECLALLERVKKTLRLPEEVMLKLVQQDQYDKDKFALDFIVTGDVCVRRRLSFAPGDVLSDDLYSMALVRFQESTGGDWTKLPMMMA